MINLLPDHIKSEIVYARRNRKLLHWTLAVFSVSILIGILSGFGQWFIISSTNKLHSTAQLTKDRISQQNLVQTQQELKNLSNDFKTVTQLLNRQFLFSKLFVKMGGIIPDKAILSGITLTSENSALDLNVIAINREAATQAFINISDPDNGIFSKADLISVTCSTANALNENPTVASKYPCSSTIKVILQDNSDLYFLNSITRKSS